jgi:flavodoxin
MSEVKRLIAYYSRAGNNIVGGNIVNLPVGNTEVAAKMVQKLTTGWDTVRAISVNCAPLPGC